MGNKSIEIFLNVIRNAEMAKYLSEIKTCWNVLMLWVYHSTGLTGIPDEKIKPFAASAKFCQKITYALEKRHKR